MGKDKTTVAEIVDSLVDAANKIVKHKISVALGLEPSEESMYYDAKHSEWVMRYIEPLIKSTQQTREVEAQSSKKIIKLLANGKINIDEAVQLMTLTKSQVDAEEKENRLALTKNLAKMLKE